MAVSGGVHLALIPHHLASEPLTSLLFLLNGVAFIALAVMFTWRWWRIAAAALLITTVLAYLVYVAIGFEGPVPVGSATNLVVATVLSPALVTGRLEHVPRDPLDEPEVSPRRIRHGPASAAGPGL